MGSGERASPLETARTIYGGKITGSQHQVYDSGIPSTRPRNCDLLMRFERLNQLHYALKTLDYTMINRRHYCRS
jgi:hypothetical protein